MNINNTYDVIIVGAGPAGIFTALELTQRAPGKKILMMDAGRRIDKRACPARTLGHCVKCKPCAIMNGWAGAGAFSDGKLSLSTEVGGNITDYIPQKQAQQLIDYCDGVYSRFGAPETVHGRNNPAVDEIDYEASKYAIHLVHCPVRHMGTEYSLQVLSGMYDHLSATDGFTFLELTRALDLIVENGVIQGVEYENAAGKFTAYAENVVIAPGRSGADWCLEMSRRHGLQTVNNAVDIGVRVECPNSIMDHLTKELYEAKLVYYSDTFENKVRTFCMNPGGIVSEEHYGDGIAVVNGHSYHDKERLTKNTNFAMLVSTTFTKPFTQPIEYGNYIARLGNMLCGGGIMVQRFGDLVKGRRTDVSRLAKCTTKPTLTTAVPGDLSFVLPHRHLTSIIEAMRAFDKLAPGLYGKDTLLYGVEVKFYSARVNVTSSFETEIKHLYAIGDGAGITRGLMQASATGVVVARAMLEPNAAQE